MIARFALSAIAVAIDCDRPSDVDDHGVCGDRSIAPQLDVEVDLELSASHARYRAGLKQRSTAADEQPVPGRAMLSAVTVCSAERGIGVQRVAGDGLARRIALVEQGGDLRLIEHALGFGLLGCGGGAALASGFGGGFLASSFFKASAIGSILGGSGFFSTGFGSSFGLVSATGFGGSGFFSTGLSTGFGGGAVSVMTAASR